MTFSSTYLTEATQIIGKLDIQAIEEMVRLLCELRQRNGRLFIIGVGGGAGHASHAVGDFRKIAGIEAYAPTDNVAERPPVPTMKGGTPRWWSRSGEVI